MHRPKHAVELSERTGGRWREQRACLGAARQKTSVAVYSHAGRASRCADPPGRALGAAPLQETGRAAARPQFRGPQGDAPMSFWC